MYPEGLRVSGETSRRWSRWEKGIKETGRDRVITLYSVLLQTQSNQREWRKTKWRGREVKKPPVKANWERKSKEERTEGEGEWEEMSDRGRPILGGFIVAKETLQDEGNAQSSVGWDGEGEGPTSKSLKFGGPRGPPPLSSILASCAVFAVTVTATA